MEQIFNDEHEPFWRSAKQMELGVIPPAVFAKFIRRRFEQTSRSIEPDVVEALLRISHSHPYGTQELAYTLWEITDEGSTAARADLDEAVNRVLRSENAHFSRIWERASRAQRLTLQALATEPGGPPFGAAYRRMHNLPGVSSVQRALETLVEDELAERHDAGYRIAEPFLADWIRRNEM